MNPKLGVLVTWWLKIVRVERTVLEISNLRIQRDDVVILDDRELARGARPALGGSWRERFGKNFLVERADGLSDADERRDFFARKNLRQIGLARVAEENWPGQFVRAADDGR